MGTYIPAELRRLVFERAAGCCEYCLTADGAAFAPHELDHVIALKHGGQTDAENLAISCAVCNKYKGSDVASPNPADGRIIPLFHPRRERSRVKDKTK